MMTVSHGAGGTVATVADVTVGAIAAALRALASLPRFVARVAPWPRAIYLVSPDVQGSCSRPWTSSCVQLVNLNPDKV